MPENPSRVSGVRQSPRSVHHASVTETVLYSFCEAYRCPDGRNPAAGLTYFKGTLYGTTTQGGAYECPVGYGCGTVYSITPSGTETLLRSFKGGEDGAIPEARMIVRNGTLYGTTYYGGEKCPGGGCGTVFSITPSGHEKVLHVFAGPPDGSRPDARLLNVNGALYGTTFYGGAYNDSGTVFSITPGGKEKILYSFGASGNDGTYPEAGLIDVKGTLYGTTIYGGVNCAPAGCGTVFSITPGGKEKVLYSFGAHGNDGRGPSGLIEVGDTLYGTTAAGGAYGDGTVFSITPTGKEMVLHSFSGGDGWQPEAALLNVNRTLYGTTEAGGSGYGTVFSITLSGHVTVLYSFTGGQDGSEPQSGLSYVNGTLYGTTYEGGAYAGGNVYSITL
jgi:uncharacterized repeat protein (TIGR03803 family)